MLDFSDSEDIIKLSFELNPKTNDTITVDWTDANGKLVPDQPVGGRFNKKVPGAVMCLAASRDDSFSGDDTTHNISPLTYCFLKAVTTKKHRSTTMKRNYENIYESVREKNSDQYPRLRYNQYGEDFLDG